MANALLDIYAAGHSTSSPPFPEGCSQIFAGCYDPNCERDCGAHRPYTAAAKAITADMAGTKRDASFTKMFCLFACIGFGVFAVTEIAMQGAENIHKTIVLSQEE